MTPYEGKNRRTVNYLRAMYFDRPEWTPVTVSLMPGTWMKHREALEALVLEHPRLWPGYRKGSRDFDALEPEYRAGRMTDCWGSVWENVHAGLVGQPVTHPLSDWVAFETYEPPDPATDDIWGPRDPPETTRRRFEAAKARGDLAVGGGLPHGFFYMRLYYLRGFENLMMDLATEDPHLADLIAMVEGYNTAVIRRHLDLGAERMSFGEDLGLQRSLPMSPAMWRQWIKPSYLRMFAPIREAGLPIRLHTDGHVLEIIPDLIEAGVKLINPQVRANGLAGLAEVARGKLAIDLDLDRQLFPFASPAEIEDHVGEAFEALHLPEGGLMLTAEVEPDLALEQIEAISAAVERVAKPPEPSKDAADA